VITKDTNHDAGSHRVRPAIKGAAILISTYIAMYLAIAGITHALTSPDAAAAIAPYSSMARAPAATKSGPPIGAGESPQSDSLGQVDEPTDNSRERRPSAAIESNCMCD
jgi:hypothetical protein